MITIIVSIITNILDLINHHVKKDGIYSYLADVVELVISLILFVAYCVYFVAWLISAGGTIDELIMLIIAREAAISGVLGLVLGVANSLTRRGKELDHHLEDDLNETVDKEQK